MDKITIKDCGQCCEKEKETCECEDRLSNCSLTNLHFECKVPTSS